MAILHEITKRLLFVKQFFQRGYARLKEDINSPPKALYPLDEEEMEELIDSERRAEWERQLRDKR